MKARRGSAELFDGTRYGVPGLGVCCQAVSVAAPSFVVSRTTGDDRVNPCACGPNMFDSGGAVLARYDEYANDQVGLMIGGVRDFISRVPA